MPGEGPRQALRVGAGVGRGPGTLAAGRADPGPAGKVRGTAVALGEAESGGGGAGGGAGGGPRGGHDDIERLDRLGAGRSEPGKNRRGQGRGGEDRHGSRGQGGPRSGAHVPAPRVRRQHAADPERLGAKSRLPVPPTPRSTRTRKRVEDLRGFEWHYWKTTFESGQATYKGHRDRVNSVVFSPDGKQLASAGHDRTVKVWDLATGNEVLNLMGHTNAVFSVAFSPDGKRLASGSWDHTVKVWDLTTGNESFTLRGHKDSVYGIAFSRDGKRLANAAGGFTDKTVKVWGPGDTHRNPLLQWPFECSLQRGVQPGWKAIGQRFLPGGEGLGFGDGRRDGHLQRTHARYTAALPSPDGTAAGWCRKRE